MGGGGGGERSEIYFLVMYEMIAKQSVSSRVRWLLHIFYACNYPCHFPVLFEIELLSFVDYRAADEFTAFSREEREKATLDQIIAVANAEKDVSMQ